LPIWKLLTDDYIDWCNRETCLPNNTHHDVKHITFEVLVRLKRRIFSDNHFMNRFPESPGPNFPVEVFKNFGICRRSGVRTGETANYRNSKSQGEVIQWKDALEQERKHHRCKYTCSHSPEVSMSIESPPVPLENICSDIAAIQCRNDPLNHFVYCQHVETDEGADHNNRK